jgi:putative ABC transport system permease protein
MSRGACRAIFGIRVTMLFHLYFRRLRLHTAQELLAGSGIAVGVALVLGVLLAHSSLLGSTENTVRGVIGRARLELDARSDRGFDQNLVERVRSLPGVQTAASVLQESAAVVGPKGRLAVQLVGVTPALVSLGGAITENIGAGPLVVAGGVGLTSTVANATGARPERSVTVLAGGNAHPVNVAAVLDSRSLGSAAAGSPIAVALIGEAQRLTDRAGRITQIFVEPYRGADQMVKRELVRLAAGRLSVVPADSELRSLRAIAKPSDQATIMFSLIGAMVGFLFTFNAMLSTVPERRRYLADLRMQGYDWHQVLLILGFEAALLGVVASSGGIFLGYILAHTLFHAVPVYLAFAFPVGSQQGIRLALVALALGCGVIATLLASLLPMLNLGRNRSRDSIFRQVEDVNDGIDRRTAARLGISGLILILVATLLVLVAPGLTLAGGVLLALATVFVIPSTFGIAAGLLRWVSGYLHSSALILAVRELRTTSLAVVALAAVGALAIYGSVAMDGARRDLLAGLDTNFREYLGTADIWVTTGGNDLTTNSFRLGDLQRRITRFQGVSSVRSYQGELMDVGTRRMWIIARPSGDRTIVPQSQLLSGNLVRANDEIRKGGAAAVSIGFANQNHLRVGNIFAIPSPSGEHEFHVAAITTNIGWPPGAIIMDASDYRRYWKSNEPSALEVNLASGVNAAAISRRLRYALSDRPGIGVQTREERESQYKENSREAVAPLSEISILLLVAAALAVASALTAAIWRRRPQLASLKIQGYDRYQLWRALLLESLIVLGFGCVIGAALGVYGHVLATRWLRLTTGFRAPFATGAQQVLVNLGLVAGIAVLVIALPGLAAARVSPRAALQE